MHISPRPLTSPFLNYPTSHLKSFSDFFSWYSCQPYFLAPRPLPDLREPLMYPGLAGADMPRLKALLGCVVSPGEQSHSLLPLRRKQRGDTGKGCPAFLLSSAASLLF